MKISEKLKLLRKEKNITQKELSDSIGVALSVIGDIESGRGNRTPSKNTALKLAKYFETSVEYWLDENEILTYVDTREDFALLKETTRVLTKNGYIKNGVPNDEGLEILIKNMLNDLKFINLKENK